MAKLTTLQRVGIAVSVISLLVGGLGAVISVYLSFSAMEAAENAGIGRVADQITHAIQFAVGGVIGCLMGFVLFIAGRSKD